MYLDYYGLKDKPFQITCDPRYLWLGEKHKEALATLRYGVLDNRGLVLLTGEVGTGKTLIINQFLSLLPRYAIVATLSAPNLTRTDFYLMLADSYKLRLSNNSKAEFLIQMGKYLQKVNANMQRLILIIDEAQGLRHNVMEEIRVLSNIEFPGKKSSTIILAGQSEFNQTLLKEENKALAQRITLRYHLESLDLDETADYIKHRLKMAGSSQNLFHDEAIESVHRYACGIPRLINILCDNALLTGNVYNIHKLDADTIEECARELNISKKKAESAFSLDFIVKPAWRKYIRWAPVCVTPLIFLFITLALVNSDAGLMVFPGSKNVVEKSHTSLSHDTNRFPVVMNSDKTAMADRIMASKITKSSLVNTKENPGMIGREGDGRVPIQFDKTNQISESSLPEIDKIAGNLVEFPERVIYVYGYTDGTGSAENQQMTRRKRIDAVRSLLISKGAYSYQVKIADKDTQDTNTALKASSAWYALVELSQNEDEELVMYNQDK